MLRAYYYPRVQEEYLLRLFLYRCLKDTASFATVRKKDQSLNVHESLQSTYPGGIFRVAAKADFPAEGSKSFRTQTMCWALLLKYGVF